MSYCLIHSSTLLLVWICSSNSNPSCSEGSKTGHDIWDVATSVLHTEDQLSQSCWLHYFWWRPGYRWSSWPSRHTPALCSASCQKAPLCLFLPDNFTASLPHVHTAGMEFLWHKCKIQYLDFLNVIMLTIACWSSLALFSIYLLTYIMVLEERLYSLLPCLLLRWSSLLEYYIQIYVHIWGRTPIKWKNFRENPPKKWRSVKFEL